MTIPSDPTSPLAPQWHTATLVALIVAVAATGMLLTAHGGPAPGPVVAAPAREGSLAAAVYLPALAVQWGLAFYVCRLGRAENAFRFLFGQRWGCLHRALGDVAIALALWSLIEAVEIGWSALASGGAVSSASAMLPRSPIERSVWVLVAVSVGICEELVYRGYLQTQLGAWTRRAAAGVVLQACLFGVAHLEQGPAAAARIALYGLALGAVARWRRSLAPSILCHVGTDLVSGLLHRA